jgi:DUF4097 and DUF4098 domain-containing protein YvlB
MRASKLFLLLGIFALGSIVETATKVRTTIDVGPAGCRVLGGKFYGPSFSFESEERLDAGGAPQVDVENSFGSVVVGAGGDGQTRVRLRTVVFQPTQEAAKQFADRVRLQVRREGERVVVRTTRAELGSSDVGFETHLTLEVPAAAAIKVKNEHGTLDVGGVASVELDNAHAKLTAARIAGDASLSARHGDVAVEDVKGALTLNQRYGDASVKDVGSLVVEAEHGDVRTERSGAVNARLKYGNLKAEGVKGDLEATGEHAGVEARDVSGNARVETSYRGISVARVAGEARLATSHGEVSAQDVAGPLTAESSYDGVTLAAISGVVAVKVDHGGVSARGIQKGGRIEASGDDVEIDGFGGALEVDAKRGDVRLAPGGALSGSLTVRAANGGIELQLPADSPFELEAAARDGEVHVALDGVRTETSSAGLFRGRIGAGGVAVKLSTEHGDVNVRPVEQQAAEKE